MNTLPHIHQLPSGPFNGIAIVGEAPGETEVETGKPFSGASGYLLDECLEAAEIERSACYITNVFTKRPAGNAVSYFFCGKREQAKLCKESQYGESVSPLSRLANSQYLKPEFFPHLFRLQSELEDYEPNIIIALGGTALWAVCQIPGITANRGVVQTSTLLADTKVLASFHPAAVLREYSYKITLIADLIKARGESYTKTFVQVDREIWLDPTLADLGNFYDLYMQHASMVSVDIETANKEFITCICFAPSAIKVIVIPFVDRSKPGYHYWPTLGEEVTAMKWVKWALGPEQSYDILGQNFGAYDMNYLYESGIPIYNYMRDAMSHHQALFPELPKTLGFLGSVYCNEIAWKTLRGKVKSEKRED